MSEFLRSLFDGLVNNPDGSRNLKALSVQETQSKYPDREHNYAKISILMNNEYKTLDYVPMSQVRMIHQLISSEIKITPYFIEALENMWNQAYDIAGTDYHLQNADESL